MSVLFSPLRLRGLELRNRVAVSPMCQYSSQDGLPNDWHLVHLGSRAVGGAGLVVAEATAVVPEGRISPGDTGIWSDAQAQAWSRIARFVKEKGAAAGVQLAHAGRKASTDVPWRGGRAVAPEAGGWTPVGPGAEPFMDDFPVPRALSVGEIRGVVDAFAAAARRARSAGFDCLELHMAHGYLVHQFLSPVSNHRDDAYGGPLVNRMRLALEVAHAVRAAWPEERPLLVRISASDWIEGGWDLEQSIALCRALAQAGVDLVDCSSGGSVPHAKVPLGPGYQVPFAEAIRRQAGVKTGAVGLITEPLQAESIVAEGKADVVFLARAMLRDPYWPLHAAQVLGAAAAWPVQYHRARP
ncbi:MAG TPA: NADH:flavin oxidoreductase/NADH oxidase [Vicinamibacteria bacterium]|nr:NADH:flavin oxidoreductase/NADH oxidase [Vicinamibacteria bacterium]